MSQLQKLSDAVGIPRGEMLSIWDTVKVNHAKLDACARHDFGPLDNSKFGAKYTCKACGGTADAIAAIWYARGLKHGAAK